MSNSALESIPVVVLAGGNMVSFSGAEIPKAAIILNGKPLLFHVVEQYLRAGFKNFYVCLGEGYDRVLKDLESLSIVLAGERLPGANVTPLFTGAPDQTGSRLRKALSTVGETQTVAITYVDTICDVDLAEVHDFHVKQGKMVTLTAVNLPTRFKVLGVDLFSPVVRGFSKKPIVDSNLISGGYYFIEGKCLVDPSLSPSIDLSYENDILPALTARGEVVYFRHEGYWQFIDGQRDVRTAERFLNIRGHEKMPMVRATSRTLPPSSI